MENDRDEDIVELDDQESESGDWEVDDPGDDMGGSELAEWARERRNTLLIGAGVIILAFFLIFTVVSNRGDSLPAEDARALLMRVERLELRMAQLDGLEAAIVNLLEARTAYPDDGALAERLDLLAGKVETLQQRMGSIATDFQSLQKAGSSTQEAARDTIRFHTVQPGETLFAITRMYNLTLDRLCSMNDLNPKETLRVGQRLRVSP
ncbi:MAG: LysM peptidoglycan-binding domain-containing protein [Syntrophales bacterium]|jgi:hypothetical protein|nr:LysM peptidoglycan-binding domain-containing protein [Syntrophales bacterium]MCK9528246.1 LysM peptidoglycan-binding domain-containing protein [Syntrophales bacterium]MDX9922377.1 LysM peptidoglycan-binding domain-containing protein [Syntrophales bacterium]